MTGQQTGGNSAGTSQPEAREAERLRLKTALPTAPTPTPTAPGTPPTALSLLESLGTHEEPSSVARRGLRHLMGLPGAQYGLYLKGPVWPTSLSGGGPGYAVSATGEACPREYWHAAVQQLCAPAGGSPGSFASPGGPVPVSATVSAPVSPPLILPNLTSVAVPGRVPPDLLVVFDTRPGARPSPLLPELLGILAQQVGKASQRQLQLHSLGRAREQMLRVLGRVLEYRSHETKGHTDRVTHLAVHLGLHLDLDSEQLTHLRWGAYLHDLGKIAIADDVLHKRGPLNPQEREWMHQHATIGEAILREQELVPPEVLEVVRHHHERWDGLGYPDHLRGEDIPLLARVFAVVDVYDALTSTRPYKPSWSRGETLEELRRMAGTHLDPVLVQAFERLLAHSPELFEMYAESVPGPNPE